MCEIAPSTTAGGQACENTAKRAPPAARLQRADERAAPLHLGEEVGLDEVNDKRLVITARRRHMSPQVTA